MQPYKEKVQQILELPWGDYSPYSIVMISLASAQEFAESLRLALEVFPDDKNLKLMAAGELETTNLTYGNYKRLGDHWQFLSYFTVRFPHEASDFIRRSSHVTEEYLDAVRSMTDRGARHDNLLPRARTTKHLQEDLGLSQLEGGVPPRLLRVLPERTHPPRLRRGWARRAHTSS